MKRTILSISVVILTFNFIACNSQNSVNSEKQKVDSTLDQSLTLNQSTEDMNSFISIFEIPATDISRAVDFYQAILEVKIEKMDFPGMKMGILPYENQVITGVIIEGEGYQPSGDGVTIYLNGGDNLQVILDKVEKNGGKIITPKTPHADESGYFAIFLDSEGNKLGLHSVN